MGSLDDPSPCFEPRILFPLDFFLPAGFDVGLIMPAPEKLTHVLRVVAFVEANMLMPTRCGLGSVNRNAIEGSFQKFDVMRVRAADLHAQRNPTSVGEYRSFGT